MPLWKAAVCSQDASHLTTGLDFYGRDFKRKERFPSSFEKVTSRMDYLSVYTLAMVTSDMKSPEKWNVKPPESDLRPTSEKEITKREWGGVGDRQKSNFKPLSTLNAGGIYTDDGDFYMLQWLSTMQLVGHINKQASVCLYRKGQQFLWKLSLQCKGIKNDLCQKKHQKYRM